MNVAIILAGGKSKRMKKIDKIFHKIKGNPLIFYTIKVFETHPKINEIVVVIKKGSFEKLDSLIKKYKFKKIIKIVKGGKTRQESAFNGLKSLNNKKGDLILFHNGANPLISQKEISDVIGAAKKYGAALVGQMAKDTIKEVDKKSFIVRTIDRKKISLAQTPQVIEYDLAKKVFGKAQRERFEGTDDVSLVERIGGKVKIVPCSYKNIKVTTQDDLILVKSFLKRKN
ncbi:2-C-methyl-D-erythritol 4-phosphate cytidylyltransferase [Patescibacteria group bacterium]